MQHEKLGQIEKLRQEIKDTGFCTLHQDFIGCANTDWNELAAQAAQLAPDQALRLPHFRRGMGLFLMLRGKEIVAMPNIYLKPEDKASEVCGFDTSDYNQQTPGPRVFSPLPAELLNNAAFRAMLHLAVAVDPCEPTAKLGVVALMVFIHYVSIESWQGEVQAAFPDRPHNDGGRFKCVFLIERNSVIGGENFILPRAFTNMPFTDDMATSSFAHFTLSAPGQGFAFLDDIPKQGEKRKPNCHHASALRLPPGINTGKRIIATVTPTPLLPSGGSIEELQLAHSTNLANTSALLDLQAIVDSVRQYNN